MWRNYVAFCGFVFAYSIPVVALSPLLQTEALLKVKGWFDVWGGIYFFQSYQPSTHPVTHLLHSTESCCFLLCCWSQVPLSWFSHILHQTVQPESILQWMRMRPALCVQYLLCYWYVILLFLYDSIHASLSKNAIFLPSVARKPPTSRIPIPLQVDGTEV